MLNGELGGERTSHLRIAFVTAFLCNGLKSLCLRKHNLRLCVGKMQKCIYVRCFSYKNDAERLLVTGDITLKTEHPFPLFFLKLGRYV